LKALFKPPPTTDCAADTSERERGAGLIIRENLERCVIHTRGFLIAARQSTPFVTLGAHWRSCGHYVGMRRAECATHPQSFSAYLCVLCKSSLSHMTSFLWPPQPRPGAVHPPVQRRTKISLECFRKMGFYLPA